MQQDQLSNPTSVEEVLAAERAWVEAHRRSDVSALDALMADEYIQIRDGGSLAGKSEVLASFQGGQRHWDEVGSDEYLVRAYGDIALLIGRWRARGINHGQRFDYMARFAAVYVKRSGRWQLVCDQSTPIQEPAIDVDL